MKPFGIRPLNNDDCPWVVGLLEKGWDSTMPVSWGRIRYAGELPGFIAMQEDKPVGLVTYQIGGDECEIVTIDSLSEGIGIVSALLQAVRDVAASVKCQRLWLITTNDNTAALRF